MTEIWSRPARQCACAAAFLLVLTGPLAAQVPTTGGIRGLVVDSAGEPLRDVFITLVETETRLRREGYSNRRGGFYFPFLEAGEYGLTIEKLGYSPSRITVVPVRPGSEVQVRATLLTVRGAVVASEERLERAALSGSKAGMGQWVPEFGVRDVPAARRDVSELARLTSQSSDELVVEGLPSWLSRVAIDGTLFSPARHPYLWLNPYRTTGFALSGISAASLVTNGLDVEWSGAAGAFLSAHSLRGAEASQIELRGHWSGSVLPGPSFADGSLSYNDIQGGAVVRSPLLADSARISLGLDIRRLQTPVSAAWANSAAAAALVGAGQGAGLQLESYRSASLSAADAVSAFGRFDWALAPRHRLAAWLQFASLPRTTGLDPLSGAMPELEGSDLLAGMNLVSSLSGSLDNNARISVTTSLRTTAESAAVGPTTIVGDGLSFGGARTAARGEETRIQFSDALHVASGDHALKFGAAATVAGHRYSYRQGADGEFYFSSVDDLDIRRGVLLRSEGPAAAANWTTTTFGLFAQDQWTASEGLVLLLGARADREPLPSGEVDLDTEWERLAGLTNNAVETTRWLPSLRAGFTWDVKQAHQWIVTAGAGIYFDRFDPLLLSQWLTDDGTGRVRREVGTIDWPNPGSAGAYRRLTMLDRELAPPRTARLSAGLVHRLTENTALHLSGVIRRTENLPRRTDLNLLPLPVARDQFGRAVFGTLVQRGALIAADPGTSRRFDGYDEVAGINSDGSSEHFGLTVGLERHATDGFGFLARYTFGRTTDNWFAAREGGWTMALPQGLDAADQWAEGTSDFDIPHRAVAAVSLAGPLGSRIGAVYRFQSGAPFTPGYRAGVDAGGDGSARNDPAFVDASFPGMAELVARWNCLTESSGRIAERNSCRGDATHALDLSVGFQVGQLGGTAASLFLDAFDLLESEHGQPDAALFLVDPAGTLTRDPVARTVNVPLLLNPNFGEELVRSHTGRKLRIGLSLNW